jgi:hypothetical protein
LVLVAGKAVLVKVNATNAQQQEANPTGRLRVETSSGQLVQEIALTAPTGKLPAAVSAVPSFTDSYNAVVPAKLVVSGLRLTASLANGQPATTINPRVSTSMAMKLVGIPLQIAGNTGQVVAKADTYLQARMPVASVSLQTHAPYVPKGVTTLPTTDSAWDEAFVTMLFELADLHALEGASDQAFYYGFVPMYTDGSKGLGLIVGNAAVGYDNPSDPTGVREIMVHEVAHNLSLYHAPCGVSGLVDSQYPYANATLGAPGRYIWGYDVETKTFIDPRRTDIHDVMSYCDGNTFSDYNYRKMQVFITPTAARSEKVASVNVMAGPQELLLVSGRVESSKVELRPLKSLFGEARLPGSGPYLLRIVTAQGTVEYPFATQQIDHIASQRFGFTIPHPGTIFSMTILKDGQALLKSEAKAAATSSASQATERAASTKPQVQVNEKNGTLQLSWDATRYPYLTVTHVGTQRSTLGQDLQGGSASLPLMNVPAGGSFEFSLSDGLNTLRVPLAR